MSGHKASEVCPVDLGLLPFQATAQRIYDGGPVP